MSLEARFSFMSVIKLKLYQRCAIFAEVSLVYCLNYSDVRERVETLIATSLKLRVVVPSPLLILVICVSSV